jgi:hypothetical protein
MLKKDILEWLKEVNACDSATMWFENHSGRPKAIYESCKYIPWLNWLYYTLDLGYKINDRYDEATKKYDAMSQHDRPDWNSYYLEHIKLPWSIVRKALKKAVTHV